MNSITFERFPTLTYACEEAFNTLCTNLSFLGQEKRVIMVTSTIAHEGKSFVSMNILRTMSKLRRKVVLVDCDLRKSTLVRKYGIKVNEGKGYGVTHYLAGRCELKDVVYETDFPHAHIIPVGKLVSNSLTLLTTAQLKRMFEELSKCYDQVIVDAPPVGVIIDAAEIAKFCDGTIFTVRYNTISSKELMEAINQIERAGCQVVGTVLNYVDMEALSSKKYYSKSYYSHYYDSDYTRKTPTEHAQTDKKRV